MFTCQKFPCSSSLSYSCTNTRQKCTLNKMHLKKPSTLAFLRKKITRSPLVCFRESVLCFLCLTSRFLSSLWCNEQTFYLEIMKDLRIQTYIPKLFLNSHGCVESVGPCVWIAERMLCPQVCRWQWQSRNCDVYLNSICHLFHCKYSYK